MKYIENNGQVTKEYEAKIDVDALTRIIKDLDTHCFRIVNKKMKVFASSKKEAFEIVESKTNAAGIKTNYLVTISGGYHDSIKYPNGYIYDCGCICKQSSHLVTILQKIIENYCSSLDFKMQNNILIDQLIGFKDSDELITYEERYKKCLEEIKETFKNDEDDAKSINELILVLETLKMEMQYNKNYDFNFLNNLYNQAKKCIKLVLVDEIIHYKNLSNNPKIHKLGTRKHI